MAHKCLIFFSNFLGVISQKIKSLISDLSSRVFEYLAHPYILILPDLRQLYRDVSVIQCSIFVRIASNR